MHLTIISTDGYPTFQTPPYSPRFGSRHGRQEVRLPNRRLGELEACARSPAFEEGQPSAQSAKQPDGTKRGCEGTQFRTATGIVMSISIGKRYDM